MKIFITKDCPVCEGVKHQIEHLKVKDKFDIIDLNDNYEGYMPEFVPVLQHPNIGTINGADLPAWLDTVYGE